MEQFLFVENHTADSRLVPLLSFVHQNETVSGWFTWAVTPCLIKCCRSSLSWCANTFSTKPSMLIGGFGKYSNQCWHQFTEIRTSWQLAQTELQVLGQLCWRLLTVLITSLWKEQKKITEDGGYDLKTNQLVVLEKFDERKRQHRKEVCLAKYWRPVSQRWQASERKYGSWKPPRVFGFWLVVTCVIFRPAQDKRPQLFLNSRSYSDEIPTSLHHYGSQPTFAEHAEAFCSWWGTVRAGVCMPDVFLCQPGQRTLRDSLVTSAATSKWTS